MDTFQFTTWNVLATAYIRSSFYPGVDAEVLDPRWRIPALSDRARELSADILCLQEVEAAVFDSLADGLAPLGYAGKLAMKDGRKPDGCATFFRTGCLEFLDEHRVVYRDGSGGTPDSGGGTPDSGHIAQVLRFEIEGRRLMVVNTHLKWDPPATEDERQYGVRQIRIALEAIGREAEFDIICGDFNAAPDSSAVKRLLGEGFDYSHRTLPGTLTCNSSREPKLIDYIFFRGPLSVEPVAVPAIDRDTRLPSREQPSDHLPLSARFQFS